MASSRSLLPHEHLATLLGLIGPNSAYVQERLMRPGDDYDEVVSEARAVLISFPLCPVISPNEQVN